MTRIEHTDGFQETAIFQQHALNETLLHIPYETLIEDMVRKNLKVVKRKTEKEKVLTYKIYILDKKVE